MFAMVQKLLLEKNSGITMPCVSLYGYKWSCMAKNGRVWVTVVYGYVWPCMAVYDRGRWPFIEVYRRLWPCIALYMALYSPLWSFMALYGLISSFLAVIDPNSFGLVSLILTVLETKHPRR